MSVEGDKASILLGVHVCGFPVESEEIVLAVDEVGGVVEIVGAAISVAEVLRFVHVQPETTCRDLLEKARYLKRRE